jgi:predicted O-methyltransferase YrrM
MKWLDQVFIAGQVAKGNIVRRKKTSVQRYSSLASLEAEVKRRGFHLVETGDQVLVICNHGSIRLRV